MTVIILIYNGSINDDDNIRDVIIFKADSYTPAN